MPKNIPTIQKFMTVMPHTIGFDQNLNVARNMMNQHRIRHLPVLKGGKLVGVLSDRDLKLVMSFADIDAEKVTVEEAYTPEPYVTKPEALLNEVVSEMASHKYGCAMITDNNKLVGIFTDIDALKALSELLETRLK